MANLRWTREALDWLEEIHSYIAQNNPTAARKVIDGIVAKAELLTRFPDIGSYLRSEREGGVRVVLYGHYRIAYLHEADSETVVILGVFHDAMNIDRYIP